MKTCWIMPMLGTVSIGLSSCAGLGAPIGSRLPPKDVTLYDTAYSNPRSLALGRIAQWDRAIRNIQGANVSANAGLAGIATTLAYRAARDLSKPATVGWATAGLFGIGISEAFVQVSRINVYSAGIRGVECALSAYGPGPIEATSAKPVAVMAPPTLAMLIEQASKIGPEGDAYVEEIARLRATSSLVLDEGLLLAVSGITRDVDSALIGTILTANSRGRTWSGTFSSAMQKSPVQESPRAPLRNQEEFQARAILLKAVAEARVMVGSVSERRARMDKCGIDGAKAELELVGSPLSIDLLGETSLTIVAGTIRQFRVYGGKGVYAASLAATSADEKPDIELTTEGITIVTIRTTATTTPGDYAVIVADADEASAKIVPFKVATPTKSNTD
jgi:hypothetical protein